MVRRSINEIREVIEKLIKEVGSRCPFEIAKHLGIIVIHQPTGDLDGMWIYRNRIKAILLNDNLSYNRQCLVCAHELGHAIMHHDINSSFIRAYTHLSTDGYEVEANLFAIELLFNSGEMSSFDELVNDYELDGKIVQLMLQSRY